MGSVTIAPIEVEAAPSHDTTILTGAGPLAACLLMLIFPVPTPARHSRSTRRCGHATRSPIHPAPVSLNGHDDQICRSPGPDRVSRKSTGDG